MGSEQVTGAEVQPEATTGATEGQNEGTQGESAELATKYAVLEERYKHSSEEGVRLHQRVKELEAADKARASSLTTQPHQKLEQGATFPSRTEYIKHWTENGEKTDKEAAAEYEREFHYWQKDQIRDQQLEALAKRLNFESVERDRGLSSLHPKAKEAQEFWADNPAMSALPISEQIEHFDSVHKKLNAPLKVKRDLSEVQNATGSTVGGAGKMAPAGNGELDAKARVAGFPSHQAQLDMNKCLTQQDYSAWKLKYKVK